MIFCMAKNYRVKRWICWSAKRPMLNKAHDAATNNGAAITTKRVSISNNPF